VANQDTIDELQREFFLELRGALGNDRASQFLRLVEEIRRDRDALRKSIRTMYCWLSTRVFDLEKLAVLGRRPEVRRSLDEADHTRGL